MAKKAKLPSINQMRMEIYDNIYGALVDDGMDEDEAAECADDEVGLFTDEEVIEQYKEMTE